MRERDLVAATQPGLGGDGAIRRVRDHGLDAGHTDPRTSDTEATERSVGGTQCPNHAIDIDQLERGANSYMKRRMHNAKRIGIQHHEYVVRVDAGAPGDESWISVEDNPPAAIDGWV